jgi:hypothetical protein
MNLNFINLYNQACILIGIELLVENSPVFILLIGLFQIYVPEQAIEYWLS